MARLNKATLINLIKSKRDAVQEDEFKLYINDIQTANGGSLAQSYSKVTTYTSNSLDDVFPSSCRDAGVSVVGVFDSSGQLDKSDPIVLTDCAEVYILLRKNEGVTCDEQHIGDTSAQDILDNSQDTPSQSEEMPTRSDEGSPATETTVDSREERPIKVACFVQTAAYRNKNSFDDAIRQLPADVDILLFPEFSYVPIGERIEIKDTFASIDVLNLEEFELLKTEMMKLSRELDKAIVICNEDKAKHIVSVYTNANATESETSIKYYIKFTDSSNNAIMMDESNFNRVIGENYNPIVYRGKRIGLTICNDCHYMLFSSAYKGVDILLNSTGGNVVDAKWDRSNRARAIENNAYAIVSMGNENSIEATRTTTNKAYAFDPNGHDIGAIMLIEDYVYIYELKKVAGIGRGFTDYVCANHKSWRDPYSILLPFNPNKYTRISNNMYGDIKHSVCYVRLQNTEIFNTKEVLRSLSEIDHTYKHCIIINEWQRDISLAEYDKIPTVTAAMVIDSYAAILIYAPNLKKCLQRSDSYKKGIKERPIVSNKCLVELMWMKNEKGIGYYRPYDDRLVTERNTKILISKL